MRLGPYHKSNLTNTWYEYPYPIDHLPFECFNDFKLPREQLERMQWQLQNEYETLCEWDDDVAVASVWINVFIMIKGGY